MAKAVATVEDFEKLANDQGLVPMTHLIHTITDRPGDIRGYAPYTALRMYNEGLAEPLDAKIAGKPVPQQTALDPEAVRRDGIDLGVDPANGHRLTKIALAKRIKGSDESMTEPEADTIIAEEQARRAAIAASNGPNAITSLATVTR